MKKISFLILIATLALVSCTDNSAVNTAFLKYGHRKGVVSITVPGFVVRFAAKFADLEREERQLLSSIDKVKVLTVEDNYLNEDIDLHAEFYNSINKDGRYEELLSMKSDDEKVTIYGKMVDEDVIKEMVVLVGGDDNALIYLKGHFSTQMINKVIDDSDYHDFMSLNF
ncbi:MAG: DUF4252 domain-containing protein [Prolixibacteraceae bacterium]|nr:DUF4252 domain-containing protein [Prolixibacteraceae bacterium]MBN2772845.1 DUF4252 domain-containing protein [Prolixibacteraceae bacterium]